MRARIVVAVDPWSLRLPLLRNRNAAAWRFASRARQRLLAWGRRPLRTTVKRWANPGLRWFGPLGLRLPQWRFRRPLAMLAAAAAQRARKTKRRK